MYNRQILVDYFKGKRTINDGEVRRELRSLKWQAKIDWRQMYAGKGTPETPENIAEDYIYNAQLTARTERDLDRLVQWGETEGEDEEELDRIGARLLKDAIEYTNGRRHSFMGMYFLSSIGPVALSAFGPAYYGFRSLPYLSVIVWAFGFTIFFLWWARPSFKHTFSTTPSQIKSMFVIKIAAIYGGTFVAVDSLVYWLARSVH